MDSRTNESLHRLLKDLECFCNDLAYKNVSKNPVKDLRIEIKTFFNNWCKTNNQEGFTVNALVINEQAEIAEIDIEVQFINSADSLCINLSGSPGMLDASWKDDK